MLGGTDPVRVDRLDVSGVGLSAPFEEEALGGSLSGCDELGIDRNQLVAVLAIAVLWMGVYPKPFTDVMQVSVTELLKHVAQSKLGQ